MNKIQYNNCADPRSQSSGSREPLRFFLADNFQVHNKPEWSLDAIQRRRLHKCKFDHFKYDLRGGRERLEHNGGQ